MPIIGLTGACPETLCFCLKLGCLGMLGPVAFANGYNGLAT